MLRLIYVLEVQICDEEGDFVYFALLSFPAPRLDAATVLDLVKPMLHY